MLLLFTITEGYIFKKVISKRWFEVVFTLPTVLLNYNRCFAPTFIVH
jgi:hypothetical protein